MEVTYCLYMVANTVRFSMPPEWEEWSGVLYIERVAAPGNIF